MNIEAIQVGDFLLLTNKVSGHKSIIIVESISNDGKSLYSKTGDVEFKLDDFTVEKQTIDDVISVANSYLQMFGGNDDELD